MGRGPGRKAAVFKGAIPFSRVEGCDSTGAIQRREERVINPTMVSFGSRKRDGALGSRGGLGAGSA